MPRNPRAWAQYECGHAKWGAEYSALLDVIMSDRIRSPRLGNHIGTLESSGNAREVRPLSRYTNAQLVPVSVRSRLGLSSCLQWELAIGYQVHGQGAAKRYPLPL
jgi:hypothetical protein